MTQDESPAPAATVEEKSAPANVTASLPATPKPGRKVVAAAPDPFAVGVRVLRMAPAWMLSMTLGSAMFVVLLGWMDAGGSANMVAHSPTLNDARAARHQPSGATPAPASLAQAPEVIQPATGAGGEPPAPVNNPVQTPAQVAATPAPTTPAPAPPAKAAPAPEPARTEAPAREDAAAKFTVQVGSFSSQSEANERVSGLRGAGFEARVVAAELQGRGTWYRVQVGRFADRGEAAKTVASLGAKGAAAGALVVPLQN